MSTAIIAVMAAVICGLAAYGARAKHRLRTTKKVLNQLRAIRDPAAVTNAVFDKSSTYAVFNDTLAVSTSPPVQEPVVRSTAAAIREPLAYAVVNELSVYASLPPVSPTSNRPDDGYEHPVPMDADNNYVTVTQVTITPTYSSPKWGAGTSA
jgi:hypothetical protein